MIRKACLGLLLALFGNLPSPPAQAPVGSLPVNVPSRNSDAAPSRGRQAPDDATVFDQPLYEDIVASEYPLSPDDLDSLVEHDSLKLPHPEGGELRLTLMDVRRKATFRVLEVRAEGLLGLITQRGDNFHATLATSRGVYSVTRQGGTTLLVNQQQLDHRILREDQRHVPTA